MSVTRKLAAILVTDIVGFSRLAGVDEERTLARIRALRGDLVAPAVAAHHGRIVKGTGDGSIVEFRSVLDAVRCAIEMQTGLAERNAGVPAERRIEFRVGIHVGDVVEESDGDLMGDGVNIAARLEGIAKPGTICLSEDAYRQVKGRLEMRVSDLGATKLKNIAEPMRAYLVEVDGPGEPLKRPASRHRFAAALAALAILVVACAAGWWFIADKRPALTASLFGPTAAVTPAAGDQPMAPHAETQSQAKTSPTGESSATPADSSSAPAVAVTPAESNQPPAPSHEIQRPPRPALTGPPDVEPTARKVVRSSARRQPSNSEPAQSQAVEGASSSSQPCSVSAAQTSGNHQSCAYLNSQPSNLEQAQPSPGESASNSSQSCFISAAQMNGNHQSCAYLRGY